MTSSNVAGKVASRLSKLEREVKGTSRPAVNKASLILKASVDKQIVAVVGSDHRLSGVGRKGAKVGVRYDIKGTQSPTSIVRATGPLHFVERGVRAHRIARRKKRGRALALKSGIYRASVQHPGMRGKRPFERGIDIGLPHALKALRDAERDALKRGFS